MKYTKEDLKEALRLPNARTIVRTAAEAALFIIPLITVGALIGATIAGALVWAYTHNRPLFFVGLGVLIAAEALWAEMEIAYNDRLWREAGYGGRHDEE